MVHIVRSKQLIHYCQVPLIKILVPTAHECLVVFGSYSVQLLDFLDIQPGPDDLVSLNTQQGHSPRRLLCSTGLRSMKVQLGPDRVSFYRLIENLYLKIWHGREKEAPVFPHACRTGEVPLWMKRLLAAIVRSITRHHRLQIMSIRSLNHTLEYQLGGRIRLRILYLFL